MTLFDRKQDFGFRKRDLLTEVCTTPVPESNGPKPSAEVSKQENPSVNEKDVSQSNKLFTPIITWVDDPKVIPTVSRL